MTLNASGPISLAGTTSGQSIEIENGGNGTTQISLNDAAVRSLAGVTTPGSTIIMPTNFYGKSNIVTISYAFTSNTSNASLAMSAIPGYSAGKSIITITNNAGVYLYSTSTGNYGLNLTGGTTGDTVTLVNNGYIMGMGGNGAGGNACGYTDKTGSAGGPALNVGIGVNITIDQTNGSAYIGGGGGGGGSHGGGGQTQTGAGGGAGGGSGGTSYRGNDCGPDFGVGGGGGGSPGSSGGNGGTCIFVSGGGGGGRVFPGVRQSTAHNGGQAGGAAGNQGNGFGYGGAAGEAGGNVGPCANSSGGGGGGWGSAGGNVTGSGGTFAGGGAAGKAVNLNGKTVTWVSGVTSRVYGAVS